MSRYIQIEAVEDLGLHYPPQDDTDDLVGVNENAPGRDLGGSAEGETNSLEEN